MERFGVVSDVENLTADNKREASLFYQNTVTGVGVQTKVETVLPELRSNDNNKGCEI